MQFRYMMAAVALLMSTSSASAFAQENAAETEFVPDELPKKTQKKQGLDGTLQASANLNLVSNDKVVGQADGLTTLVGVGVVGNLDWVHGRQELRNSLKLSESFSRTPTLPQFIKSDDVLEAESLYDYFLLKWAGLFARLNLDTALFKAEAITADPVNYEITDADGNTRTVTSQRLPLSDGFQPLTLRETFGVFAEPVQRTEFALSTRVGFGLRETWAQNVYVVADDDETAPVEVNDITNPNSSLTVFQAGLEAFVGMSGALLNKRVTYEIGSTVLVPFINNDPQNRTASDLTRFGVAADVGLKVVDWLSINYKFRLLRDPQIIEDIQVQNNLLLSLNYTFIDTKKDEKAAPTEPSESEKAAVERAEAAEKRATDAEAEAKELREKLEAAEAAPPTPEPQPEPEPTPEPEP